MRSSLTAAALAMAAAALSPSCVKRAALMPPAKNDAPTAEYRNPILPGFYPDPSACRAGDEYYLVTSSFEYFPGVPIFQSKDLVHWRQIGHCLTRPSQLPLAHAKSSQGIFAPTLRFHQGTFYLVTTNVSGGGSFYVTAKDPSGPWSEPVWLRESSWGMDPSLLFDDDGKVYYTRHGEREHGGIFQAELDIEKGELKGEARLIWRGTGGVWPEGPHLYHVGHYYYLLISEGGTGYEHMLTVARSPTPWGPFEPYAENPILSHRAHRDLPIQATGHGDLVEAVDGAWWVVLLGIRPWDRRHHHLGRETFLAPVTWNAAAWPEVNHRQPIALRMDGPGLASAAETEASMRDDFSSERLSFEWNFLRNPHDADWSLTARPGFLRLLGTSVSLDTIGSPAFVGRRQQHFRCRASAELQFEPQTEEQEAGLTVRANEDNHYDLAVFGGAGGRRVRLRTRIHGISHTVAEGDLAAGPVILSIQAREDRYEFFFATPGGASRSLGAAPTAPLSSEEAGGFTGAYFGMYASAGSRSSMPPADFDWFEYAPLP